MSIASVASQQSGTTASASATSGATSSGNADPLASLSSNFGSFLSLLMTQLQNQDPRARSTPTSSRASSCSSRAWSSRSTPIPACPS